MKRYVALLICFFLVFIAWAQFRAHLDYIEQEFVIYGLIRNGAIYTFLGDKPVSTFADYSLEEENEEFDGGKKEDSDFKLGKNDFVLDKSKIKFTKDSFYNHQKLPSLCSSWQKRHKLEGKNFVLVFQEKGEINSVTLVNKRRAREVMEEHYQSMVQSLGVEFDIDDVLDCISSPDSFFWTHIMNVDCGDICPGLMYGFGIENAIKFQAFRYNGSSANDTAKENSIQSLEDRMNILFALDITLTDIILPQYELFFDPDPVLEHYKQERARIQQEYKDVDLHKLFLDAFK